MQREFSVEDQIENVFYGDGLGFAAYSVLGMWCDYQTTKTKTMLRDGTDIEWGPGYVLFSDERLAKLLGVHRSAIRKILTRLEKRKLILVRSRSAKIGTLIQVVNLDHFFSVEMKTPRSGTVVEPSSPRSGDEVEHIKNIIIQQRNNITNKEDKKREQGGPGGEPPSLVGADATDPLLDQVLSDLDLIHDRRRQEDELNAPKSDLPVIIELKPTKRARTKRAERALQLTEQDFPVSLYSSAVKLLQIAEFEHPHLTGSKTWTPVAFAQSLSKALKAIKEPPEFAPLLVTFIDEHPFWRPVACVPHGFCIRNAKGMRKIDNIYLDMKKQYGGMQVAYERSLNRAQTSGYIEGSAVSWLYDDQNSPEKKDLTSLPE